MMAELPQRTWDRLTDEARAVKVAAAMREAQSRAASRARAREARRAKRLAWWPKPFWKALQAMGW